MAAVERTLVLEMMLEEEHDDYYDFVSVIVLSALSEENRRIRIGGYFERIVPMYSEVDFKSHFRMGRSTMEILCQDIIATEMIPREPNRGRECISPDKQILMSIWMLANQEGYRQISDRFDVTLSSVFRCFKRVCEALVSISSRVISWSTGTGVNEVTNGFEDMKSFPRALGPVDGCHIQIKIPNRQEHPAAYLNRKKDYSILLQAICDHNMQFTDIFVGWPGSVHDARVLKNSPVFSNHEDLFQHDTHILGDAAYPATRWLLTPYRDNGNLTEQQKNYNYCHSVTRQTIERAFGLLKGQWHHFRFLELNSIDDMVDVVVATCTLHNICLQANDTSDEICYQNSQLSGNDDDVPEPNETCTTSATAKRDLIAQFLFHN